MNPVIRFLRGEIRVCISGAYVERCFNLFAEEGIVFWDLCRKDELRIELSMLSKEKNRLEALAVRSFCTVEILRERGFLQTLRPLRARPILAFGAAAVIGLTFFLQSFVWVITVEGEETVHEETILRQLEELGIRFGTWAPSVDSQMTRAQMLNRVPELSWLAVNRTGGKLTVLVTERSVATSEKPPYAAGSIVALRDGVITDYRILEGMRLCKRSDVVKAGQILVSGYEDYGLYLRAVCADAEIYAQTWHNGTVVMPAQRTEKSYTGREWTQISLIIGRKRINLCGNSGIYAGSCDKMIDVKKITLAGYTFPVTVETVTYREYEEKDVTVDADAAHSALSEAWQRQTRSAMVAGTIEQTEESFLESGGLYVLQAKSTCNEMIARLVPIEEPYKGESNE